MVDLVLWSEHQNIVHWAIRHFTTFLLQEMHGVVQLINTHLLQLEYFQMFHFWTQQASIDLMPIHDAVGIPLCVPQWLLTTEKFCNKTKNSTLGHKLKNFGTQPNIQVTPSNEISRILGNHCIQIFTSNWNSQSCLSLFEKKENK